MKLSALQKYILKQCANGKNKAVTRSIISFYYANKKNPPNRKDLSNIIARSIDRLIKKELVVGYGKKTAHKWFIYQVKLTSSGKKIVRDLYGIQQKLPLKNKK